ncbi:MAG: SRPBCC family protein [Flavipsychrobacter sp.]|nr:SRPBCC family protein [Flavipsychrobacter sp.]
MTTTITKSFHVDHPIDAVWNNLTNPTQVVTCVPGASLTEQIDNDNYKGEVELKFGPVKAKYDGLITFLERDAATKKMSLKGTGTDSKGKGGADMKMDGLLSEKDGGTDVNVTMEVNVTGMMAQFGSRLINDVSNQVFDQFVNNFKKQLAGEQVDNTLSAGSMVGGMIKGFFGGKK